MVGEFITDFLREVFLVWPGAFIRWLWFGRKKSIAEHADDDSPYNYILSFFVLLAITLIIVAI